MSLKNILLSYFFSMKCLCQDCYSSNVEILLNDEKSICQINEIKKIKINWVFNLIFCIELLSFLG